MLSDRDLLLITGDELHATAAVLDRLHRALADTPAEEVLRLLTAHLTGLARVIEDHTSETPPQNTDIL